MKKLDGIIGFIALIAFFFLLFEQTRYALPFLPALRTGNRLILVVFTADVLFRFLIAPKKRAYLKAHWFDLIVLVPYIQFIKGIEGYSFFTMVRQAVIFVMLISRTRKTRRFVASLGLRPAQLMITSFFFTICVGALLLSLPVSQSAGSHTSLFDAFFTATSATCVTGLIVHDTGTHFSVFGQVVILGLIQIGGLGTMTFSVFLAITGGRKMGMQQRIVMQDVLDYDSLKGATRLILFIVRMTLIIELLGAVALMAAWHSRFPALQTVYYSVFHSISAFCNAGFSLFSDSLMSFADDPATNSIIALLIIMGGLGFIAIRDLYVNVTGKKEKREFRAGRLKIQTRIVLVVSVLLLCVGALALFSLEDSFGNRNSSLGTGIWLSFFQSVSTRTAGFNSCDIGALSHASLFVMILLMFIGASPGSTGGGLKTTTFAVLWASMMNGFSQNEQVEILKRTIPAETIQKALTVLLFYLVLIVPSVIILLAVEKLRLIHVLFESVSAVATVGLSTGITAGLSVAGKTVLICLMFVGRLGPLTIGYALLLSRRKSNYLYAEERVMIG